MSDLSEYAPLGPADELPIHQSVQPLRMVSSTDPRWFERYWFSAWDDSGEFLLVAGIGQYPNLGRTDAYALLVHEGKQTTVRAWGPLGLDRSLLALGPLEFTVVAPFKEWRLQATTNDQQLTFDLRWRDSKLARYARLPPSDDLAPPAPGIFDVRVLNDQGGYRTFGRVQGTIEFEGRTFNLSPEHASGSRDHHWGVRDGVGGAGHMLGPRDGGSYFGPIAEFKDWAIWGFEVVRSPGHTSRPGASTLKPLEARLRFDPETKHFIWGQGVYRLPDGEVFEITCEQIGSQVAYLRTGGYTGCNGLGTPEEDVHHGSAEGEGVAGETYDITSADVRRHIAGREEHLVQASCNGETVVGMVGCLNPALYEMAAGGVRNMSIDDGQ